MEDFEDEDILPEQKSTTSKISVIIFIILGVIIAGLIVGLFLVIFLVKKKIKEKTVSIYHPVIIPEINENFFGEFKRNLTYDKDGEIKNTFGNQGTHHIDEVGNVHNGENYVKTDYNIYDLYIPSSALLNNNAYQGIFLFIHGGAWVGGAKKEMDKYFINYGQMGFITANMDYTLLKNNSFDTNIFRIVDEITACIEDIKTKLINKGFKEDKLEIALFGYSAGAHLALLYSYLIDDSPIKIKFVVDICGPVSLDRNYTLALKKVNDTLNNLTLPAIEEAIRQGRLGYTVVNDPSALLLLNFFTGCKYKYSELLEMIIMDGNVPKINYENPKYKELHKITNYAFPLTIEDKNKVPTLCYYDGNDEVVGVTAYAYFDKKSEEEGRYHELIYSKYAFHDFYNFDVEDSVESLRKLNLKILEFAKTYFSKE